MPANTPSCKAASILTEHGTLRQPLAASSFHFQRAPIAPPERRAQRRVSAIQAKTQSSEFMRVVVLSALPLLNPRRSAGPRAHLLWGSHAQPLADATRRSPAFLSLRAQLMFCQLKTSVAPLRSLRLSRGVFEEIRRRGPQSRFLTRFPQSGLAACCRNLPLSGAAGAGEAGAGVALGLRGLPAPQQWRAEARPACPARLHRPTSDEENARCAALRPECPPLRSQAIQDYAEQHEPGVYHQPQDATTPHGPLL